MRQTDFVRQKFFKEFNSGLSDAFILIIRVYPLIIKITYNQRVGCLSDFGNDSMKEWMA